MSQYARELAADYRAVRNRLWTAPKRMDAITAELAEARATIAERDKAIVELQRINADIEARAGEYCRTLMHYLCQHDTDEVSPRPKRSIRAIILDELRNFPDVTIEEVLGPRRTREVTAARFAAIAAVKSERTDLSYPQIGREFNRDHTSILHAVRTMEKRRKAA